MSPAAAPLGLAPRASEPGPRVGILALQGGVARHAEALAALGAVPVEVRSTRDLVTVKAMVFPGGESTTMSKLLVSSGGLFEDLRRRLEAGMPAFGTCAGAILLATDVIGGGADQRSFGAIDIAVRRNAFGRQFDSFETNLVVNGLGGHGLWRDSFPGVFIRAPAIERVGPDVEVLARVGDQPVLCRQGSVTVAVFHPELSGDVRLHRRFLEQVC